MVGVYLDDLMPTRESSEEINIFKQQMMSEFDRSDLGLLTFYLRIEVAQEKAQTVLKQSSYAKKVLD